MAIKQSFLWMDEYFRNTTGDKVIVNDLSYFDINDIEMINQSLMTVYNTDVLSTIPSCDCGATTDRYNLGKVCDECGTTVKEVHSKVQPLLWLKALSPELRFINPAFWLALKKRLHKSLDLVRWMSDAKYNPPVEIPSFMAGIKDILEGERTYSNMVKNLPKILQYLINHPKFKEPKKQRELIALAEIYNKERNKLFSDYLPIINKKLFVVENTTKGKFTNLVVSDVIDVVMLWLKVNSDDNVSDKKKEQATVNTISLLSDLFSNYLTSHVIKKPGLFRKHIYSARMMFTFRSVIVSIPGPHEYDELHIPWSIGVTVFRPHILNKLENKYGFTHIVAERMLYRAVNKYDEMIDTIMQELINEAQDGRGIPVLGQRNQICNKMGFVHSKECPIAA